MTESSDYESVQVFIGVDVGKDTHHAVAINRSGKRLFDKALPNDENKLTSYHRCVTCRRCPLRRSPCRIPPWTGHAPHSRLTRR
ncbi:ISSfl2 ORF [Shigella flexneri]|nr:ISSfl2 ORF [Shigella flexneri]